MFTYEIMNQLPAVPPHFIMQALHSVNGSPMAKVHASIPGRKEFRARMLTLPDGRQIPSAGSDRYPMSPEYDVWVKENIKSEWAVSCAQRHTQVSNTIGPHIDDQVNELLYFILQEGGTNVETVWWQENGYEIERPDKLPTAEYYDAAVNDYNNLKEIDRIRIPVGVWVRMNTMILHSVENMTGVRIGLSIRY
jgi:hypothetical protein